MSYAATVMRNSAFSISLLICVLLLSVAHSPAPDSHMIEVIRDSSSLPHKQDPSTSTAGLIRQTLEGLGLLGPDAPLLHQTTVTPSTMETMTYTQWPLADRLMPKPWVEQGVPGFYVPAVEPPDIIYPVIENTWERKPNSYVYSHSEQTDIRPPSYNNGQLVAPSHENPDFDLTGVSALALRKFATRNTNAIAGGLAFADKLKAIQAGFRRLPGGQFRSASIWDFYDAPNDPRAGNDEDRVREQRHAVYRRSRFDYRNPREQLDPKDPQPSYSIREACLPEFRTICYPGGF